MNTKASIIPAIAFLAALALLPASIPAATAALSVIGLLWIASKDYAAEIRPLHAREMTLGFAS
jgi:hypothetical protein